VGIDRCFLPSLYYDVLCGRLPGVEFVDNQAIFDRLRAVKSPVEVKRLTEANMATARAITEAFEMAKEGDTEREIAMNMGTSSSSTEPTTSSCASSAQGRRPSRPTTSPSTRRSGKESS
jgi:hypothetical protein